MQCWCFSIRNTVNFWILVFDRLFGFFLKTNKPHYLNLLHFLSFRKHLFSTHGSNLDCLPKLFITNLTGFISIPLFLVIQLIFKTCHYSQSKSGIDLIPNDQLVVYKVNSQSICVNIPNSSTDLQYQVVKKVF